MGSAGGRRRARLRALLRRAARQEGAHQQAQVAAQGRRRALPRHRRGPRGRGDRLAPARRAQAQGAGAPDGLPRDHQAGDPRRRGEPPRARPRPRRGPGGAAHPRPPLRLRGLPGPVAQGHVGPVGRPRAVRRHPDGRRPGARADALPGRVLLGPRGHLRRRRRPRPADVPGQALLRRRLTGRPRRRLRRRRRARQEGRRPPRPLRRRGAGRRARRHGVRRPLGGVQALPALAVRLPSARPPSSRRPPASSG